MKIKIKKKNLNPVTEAELKEKRKKRNGDQSTLKEK